MQPSVVAGHILGLRDQIARVVVTMVRRKCGRMAGEESRIRGVGGAVTAGGARDPNEVTARVGDEEKGLRRGAEGKGDEVLAGAEGRAGSERELGGGGFLGLIAAVVEGGVEVVEAANVGWEGLRRVGRERVIVVL